MPGPLHGQKGETKFGFTIDERVAVTRAWDFNDGHGTVFAFGDKRVAIDLNEPPPGKYSTYRWFEPSELQKAPA